MMTSMYILRTGGQRPTTDLASWKISNGNISATDHPELHLQSVFAIRRGSRSFQDIRHLSTLEEGLLDVTN